MSCSNCFNGCTEIVSDRCVRYTGIDVPVLGIKNGDSLSYVEQALIEFLTATLDGTGIHPIVDPSIICDLVKNNLPTCGDLSLNDFLTALIKSACQLQAQVDILGSSIVSINNQLAALEGSYNTGCLTGVDSSSGTHNILQAVITRLCQFIVDVEANYVQLADIDSIIAAYLASQAPSTIASKMVPYTVVEYYPPGGDLSNFDNTGKGLGDWDKIYLCNGQNGTPDKRGVVGVGINDGSMGASGMSSLVNPAIPGNPTYSFTNGIQGINSIVLTTSQMPSHTHTNNVNVTDPGHFTNIQVLPSTYTEWNRSTGSARPVVGIENVTVNPAGSPQTATTTTKAYTGINVEVSINPEGGNTAHSNYQPGLGCYYIMYIP